jgi:riboflavin kinase, archaea type
MKPYLIQMLKELALLGAIKNRIEVSSMELSEKLQTSQQTASRYLLELDNNKAIEREMGIKKQLIRITKKGSEILENEFLEYKHIFELPHRIYFVGTVVSGSKEGSYYVSKGGYMSQFEDKIGFKPYPGTLNVKIETMEKNKLRFLRKVEGIEIEPFEENNKSFGGAKCFYACINATSTILCLPRRGHYSNVLEFLSESYLRDSLKLEDGDRVQIVVTIENQLSCEVHDEEQ